MNQTAYSQCELLALACESEAARAKPDRGRSRNRQQARQPAEREPALPNGYVHIRSAIEALMALTRSPGCIKLGDRSRAIPAVWVDVYEEDTMQATALTDYGPPLAPVSELELTINRALNGTTVHCRGRITVETAPSLRAAVQPLFSHGSSLVVLDLINVSYVDSAGLGAIVGLCASAKAASCQLKLMNLNGRVRESLSLARVNELLVDPAFWRTW